MSSVSVYCHPLLFDVFLASLFVISAQATIQKRLKPLNIKTVMDSEPAKEEPSGGESILSTPQKGINWPTQAPG